MWTLEHPESLLLLLPLCFLVWFRHFSSRRRGFVKFSLSLWGGERFQAPITWQAVIQFSSALVFWLGFICLIVALSGPALVNRNRIFMDEGIDMMVVLDCSPSMAAQDHGNLSRFDHARQTIKDFMSGRTNDPMGLIEFASDASLRTPLTLDYRSFQASMDRMQILDEGDGTAIGVGLSLAALHLKEAGDGKKVIILLTDGENNAGEISPELAIAMLQELGIKVYSIGIGSVGEVPLEYVDPTSGKVFRGTYQSGFNDSLLKDLAAKTGGQYFAASQAGSLESIFQSIDANEKTEPHLRIEIVTTSLIDLFVLLGLVCIVFDILVSRILIKELV